MTYALLIAQVVRAVTHSSYQPEAHVIPLNVSNVIQNRLSILSQATFLFKMFKVAFQNDVLFSQNVTCLF